MSDAGQHYEASLNHFTQSARGKLEQTWWRTSTIKVPVCMGLSPGYTTCCFGTMLAHPNCYNTKVTLGEPGNHHLVLLLD